MDPAGDVELTQIHGEKRSANNNNTDTVDQASPGNGACVVDGGTEDASLLGRGEDADGDGVESDETSRLDPPVGPEVTAARAVFCGFWPLACRRKLNKKVVGNLRLWMVLILLIIFIALVIIISILTCSAARQEPEDQYDVSSFVLRRLFRGNVSSNSTDAALEDEFHAQLNHVFQSSAALGRYFNQSRTASRKGDVVQFCLHFHMPVDSARLVNFTLSLEMVSNVLLQHLYDRGFEEADRLKLDPASLSMEEGGSGCRF
ncbi:TPA-induced transmembrane protein isoform X2 [Denticeps clupeoides]|uniref:TPA-induced transmembrane protein isoform X2 n=1 Tax=Denticeps clupeoides TaxID=299321 RepID=UPI0010A41F9B|nr:TPA-induced transmembrane protein isoform X2 [Denticeps clupeoides]